MVKLIPVMGLHWCFVVLLTLLLYAVLFLTSPGLLEIYLNFNCLVSVSP